VLIDFGMCTSIGQLPNGGNEMYSPPEQGLVQPPRDVFGFGLILYQMLSGQCLFAKICSSCRWDSLKLLSLPLKKTGMGAFAIEQIPFENHVPPQLKNIVCASLTPNPDIRIKLDMIINQLQKENSSETV